MRLARALPAAKIPASSCKCYLFPSPYWERVNEPVEAARHYRVGVALDPSDKNAHYDFANVLADSGDAEASLKEYREAIRCDPAF